MIGVDYLDICASPPFHLTLSVASCIYIHLLTVSGVLQVLTTGADKLCAMWDMEYHEPVQRFEGHSSDILGYVLTVFKML